MTAQYEWRDETGLGHPSLVYLDITDIQEELCKPFEHTLEQAKVIKVKQLDSFEDVFMGNGWLDLRKVRVKGMEFVWHHRVMNTDYYALFVAFRQKNTTLLREGGWLDEISSD